MPDSDRWWASAGLTYRLSEKAAIDFAYTHVFFENDAPFERDSLTGSSSVAGTADQSGDIVSVGFKYKFGPRSPEPLK